MKTWVGRDPRQLFAGRFNWKALLNWVRAWSGFPVEESSKANAEVTHDRAAVAQVLQTSRAADRLVRSGDFDAGVLLYERATRLALELPGAEHSAAMAVSSVADDFTPLDTDLPADVQLARARLRAAVAHKFAGLRRQSSERLRRVTVASLLLVAVCGLAWHAQNVWRHRGERELAQGKPWTTPTSFGAEKSGKVTPINWWGDHAGYLFHTDLTEPPRVTIDLGARHSLTRVEITNRLDCCYERAAGLELWLSQDGVEFSHVRTQDPPRPFRFLTFEFPAQSARFVRLSLPTPQYLHLAEVRVYGK